MWFPPVVGTDQYWSSRRTGESFAFSVFRSIAIHVDSVEYVLRPASSRGNDNLGKKIDINRSFLYHNTSMCRDRISPEKRVMPTAVQFHPDNLEWRFLCLHCHKSLETRGNTLIGKTLICGSNCKYHFMKTHTKEQFNAIKEIRKKEFNGYFCLGCNSPLLGNKLKYCKNNCKTLSQKYINFCGTVNINPMEITRIQYIHGRVCIYKYCNEIISASKRIGVEFCSTICTSRSKGEAAPIKCKLETCSNIFIPENGHQVFCNLNCRVESKNNTKRSLKNNLHPDNQEWKFNCIHCNNRLAPARLLFCDKCYEECRNVSREKINKNNSDLYYSTEYKNTILIQRQNLYNGFYCIACDMPLMGQSLTYCPVTSTKGAANTCADNWNQYKNHCISQGHDLYKSLTRQQYIHGKVCLNEKCDEIIGFHEKINRMSCSSCKDQTKYQTQKSNDPDFQKKQRIRYQKNNPNWSHEESIKRQKKLLQRKIPLYLSQKQKDNITGIWYPLIRLEMEHCIPKSKGGTDLSNNLQLLARYSNVSIKTTETNMAIIKERAIEAHIMFEILGAEFGVNFNNYHSNDYAYANWPIFYEKDETKINQIKYAKHRDRKGRRLYQIRNRKLHLKHPDYPFRFGIDQYVEQQGICPICQYPSHIMDMVPFHIIPKSRGGPNDKNNLLLTCHNPCNVIASYYRTKVATQNIVRELLDWLDGLRDTYNVNLNEPNI